MIWSGSGATGDMSATMNEIRSLKHAFAIALNPPAGGETLYGAATLSGAGSVVITGQTYTLGATSLVRIYTLEIRDSSGNLVNILENAHDISYTQEINAPYSLSFSIPSDDSKEASVLLSNEYWLRNSAGTIIKKFKLLRKTDTR